MLRIWKKYIFRKDEHKEPLAVAFDQPVRSERPRGKPVFYSPDNLGTRLQAPCDFAVNL